MFHTKEFIMNKTLLIASMGMLAIATSASSMALSRGHGTEPEADSLSGRDHVQQPLAWDSRKRDETAGREEAIEHRERTQGVRQDQGFDYGMQAVPTTATSGQPGDGWLFFSHPAADRAVVISPQGEYYLSNGRGLRMVAVTRP
jgi:hypothetical protein